jgi:hypothetical protein
MFSAEVERLRLGEVELLWNRVAMVNVRWFPATLRSDAVRRYAAAFRHLKKGKKGLTQ